MELGDKVIRRPVTLPAETINGRAIRIPREGTVVYIHPRGRFHVVEFQVRGGKVRESFLGV